MSYNQSTTTVNILVYPPLVSSLRCLYFKMMVIGTSLVAQWLRICLPMQETRVWSLVWEDPTGCGVIKSVHHNYWACALESASHNCWAFVPQLLKPAHLESVLRNKRSPRTARKSSPHSPQLEKACVQQGRPNAAKNKLKKKKEALKKETKLLC